MTDYEKMRKVKVHIETKIKEFEESVRSEYNDIHAREKYRAIVDAYIDCYEQIFGEYGASIVKQHTSN